MDCGLNVYCICITSKQAQRHPGLQLCHELPTISPLPDPYFTQVWTNAPDVWNTDTRSNTFLIIPVTLTLLLAFVSICGGISISCNASWDNDLIYKSFPFNILLTLHRMVCHRGLCLASTNPLCHTSDLQ